jgi:3-oxo-5-alpha-steroid 4-dehydrogenase 1
MNTYPDMMRSLFPWFVWSWIGFAILLFPLLLKVSAPYGMHVRKGWGMGIPNRLSWIIMELPAMLVIPFFFFFSPVEQSKINYFFLALWLLHYVHRTLLFPFRIHTKGKKMPLSVVGMALFFNLVNGGINGYYLAILQPSYPASWLHDPRLIVGVLLFLSGMLLNVSSDQALINLRKNSETGYAIPQAWMFRRISCPNFFGEIVEWTGFALLTWSLPALAFLVWTIVNLLPRALDHHRWYHSHFSDYPPERKALIPFLL